MNDGNVRYSTGNSNVPRIVAATIKNKPKHEINDWAGNPRIAGDLRVVERSGHHLRYAEVRNGGLVLYRYESKNKVWDCRIPLYNLNINLDSPKHYSQFSLSKYGEITPMNTFQVVKEQDYKKWLKALVVEIIRQTPLNTLKFLDVLFISELLDKQKHRKSDKLSALKNIHLSKLSAEIPVAETKTQRSNSKENKISSLLLKYQTFEYDVNHNKQPVDFIEHDYVESENVVRSFDLSAPVTVDRKLDRKIKSSDSFDSGFCSLQSTRSEDCTPYNVQHPHCPRETAKPKTKLRRADSFRINVSSSCFNLLNKFKRIGVKENNDSSQKCDSPAKSYNESASEKQEKKRNGGRIWEFMNPRPNREPELEQVHKTYENPSEREDSNLKELEPGAMSKRRTTYQSTQEQVRKNRFRISSFLHESKYSCAQKNSPVADNTAPAVLYPRQERPGLLRQRNYEYSETDQFSKGCAPDLRTVRVENKNSIPDVLKDLPETRPKRKPSVDFQLPEELLQSENADVLVRLLTKCQIDKEYVPVREKRLMFESLSRFSFSTDNLKKRKIFKPCNEGELTRSSSLQNVYKSPVPVRVMKKYFESFSDQAHRESTWSRKTTVTDWISATSAKYR